MTFYLKLVLFFFAFTMFIGAEWHILAKYEPEIGTELALEQGKDIDNHAHQKMREYYAFRDVLVFLVSPIFLGILISVFFLTDIKSFLRRIYGPRS